MPFNIGQIRIGDRNPAVVGIGIHIPCPYSKVKNPAGYIGNMLPVIIVVGGGTDPVPNEAQVGIIRMSWILYNRVLRHLQTECG